MPVRCTILLSLLSLTGCKDAWECDSDEALAGSRCSKRLSALPTMDAGPADAGGANDAAAKDASEVPVDPRIAAHGTPCMGPADCSELASVCSMRLGDQCPTAGCCISVGCDESDAESCPVGWVCTDVPVAGNTYCLPEE